MNNNVIVLLFTLRVTVFCDIQRMPVYVNRSAWGSKQPKNPGTEYSKPPSVVLVSHFETLKCDTIDHCKHVIKHIQEIQMTKANFTDIEYNFLIGKDGTVYVGLDWKFQPQLWSEFNGKRIEIALIGNFTNDASNTIVVVALKNLLDFGVFANKLDPEYIIYKINMPWSVLNFNESNTFSSRWHDLPSIVSRSKWGAEEPVVAGRDITVLPSYVILGDARRMECTAINDCKKFVKEFQINQTSNEGLTDIDCHFLIGLDGNVYEGRGWNIQADNFGNNNYRSIFIRVIGHNLDTKHRDIVFKAINDLLVYGVAMGKLNPSYIKYTEARLSTTSVPFSTLYTMWD